ncbi:MAG: hypothetical protein COA79_04470 [Planctomycetota bacterium]|nr:MAG: hypothetical protein COA79_04470 [Planctomycetota bacterium]
MTKDPLYSKLRAIGFNVNAPILAMKKKQPTINLNDLDIETILLQACYAVESDSRMLSLLFSWGKVHGNYIIANKFLKYYKSFAKYKGECPWVSAFCAYMVSLKKQKFQKGVVFIEKKIHLGGKAGLKMKGVVPYLKEINIFIPNGSIRIREQDAIRPDQLLESNLQYKCRYLYGANFRADIIYAILLGFKNPNRIAKALEISYENVRDVYNDFKKLQELKLIKT